VTRSSTCAWSRVPIARCVRFSCRHFEAVAVHDVSPAAIEAEYRKRRNQHGDGEQKRCRLLVELASSAARNGGRCSPWTHETIMTAVISQAL